MRPIGQPLRKARTGRWDPQRPPGGSPTNGSAQRLRRAWSLQDVVRELCDLADRLGERPLGVSPTMVYNWETGRHRPRSPYPRLLCLLYECSAEDLGLWEPAGPSELRRAGGLVVPPPGFAGRWPERPLHVSEATIHNLENVTAAYRRMYHTVAAHDLIDDVAQHAQTTAGFWRRAADPELRRSLAAATSEITMLAGRMSFFDLGRPSQAEPTIGTPWRPLKRPRTGRCRPSCWAIRASYPAAAGISQPPCSSSTRQSGSCPTTPPFGRGRWRWKQ